jgi:hypothetical protein
MNLGGTPDWAYAARNCLGCLAKNPPNAAAAKEAAKRSACSPGDSNAVPEAAA